MTAALFGLSGLALGVVTGLRYAAASQRIDDILAAFDRDADINAAAEHEDAE